MISYFELEPFEARVRGWEPPWGKQGWRFSQAPEPPASDMRTLVRPRAIFEVSQNASGRISGVLCCAGGLLVLAAEVYD